MTQQRQPVPFETQNEALALTLAKYQCKLLTIKNIYTAETVRRLGFATARDAWKAKAKGMVVYVFEPSATLNEIITGWTEAEKAKDDAEKREIAAFTPEQCTPREFGEIAQMILSGRSEFGRLWQFQTPRFREYNGKASVIPNGDEHTLHSPGFRECSIDAPDFIKRKLGFLK